MTGRCRLEVDHVGILGARIGTLAEAYRRLGFQVVGPAELVAVDEEGRETGLGQQSAHVMFGNSYIELMAVTRPSPEHHLARFLDRPQGLRLLILGSADLRSQRERCDSAGLAPGPVQTASRLIHYGERGVAKFEWFALAGDRYPEALVAYVRHRTPEIVFQEAAAIHENGAFGLSRLVIAGDAVPERYRRLASDAGGIVLEARPPEAVEALSGATPSSGPPFALLGILVKDVPATERALSRNGVRCRRDGDRLLVAPEDAGGVGLMLERPE